MYDPNVPNEEGRGNRAAPVEKRASINTKVATLKPRKWNKKKDSARKAIFKKFMKSIKDKGRFVVEHLCSLLSTL